MIVEIRRRHAAGESPREVALTLGISETSCYRWLREERPVTPFRPVHVTEPPNATHPSAPSASLSLVAPGGYRIEGLSVEDAARLLRALG